MKWLLGNVSRLYGKKLTMMGDSCQNVDLNWMAKGIDMILRISFQHGFDYSRLKAIIKSSHFVHI